MRIALAQLNYIIGDFDGNTTKIIETIEKCKHQNVDLFVFAELSVCGYPPRDFLEFDDFIDKSYTAIDKIAAHCKGIAAIVGAPSHNPGLKGKNLFNSAWLLADGKVQAMAHKALLPTYDVFDEYRYFEPNLTFECIDYKGVKIALIQMIHFTLQTLWIRWLYKIRISLSILPLHRLLIIIRK